MSNLGAAGACVINFLIVGLTDTTHHPAALYAYFGYRDAPAIIEWLERAFGFETTMRFPDDDGGVARSRAASAVFSRENDL